MIFGTYEAMNLIICKEINPKITINIVTMLQLLTQLINISYYFTITSTVICIIYYLSSTRRFRDGTIKT